MKKQKGQSLARIDFDNTMRRIRESAEDIEALFGQISFAADSNFAVM